MKTHRQYGLVVLAFILASGCESGTSTTGSKSARGGEAVVTFVNPERYTDFRETGFGATADRAVRLSNLERYIRSEAEYYLPAGRHLDVQVMDIDQGGMVSNQVPGGLRVAGPATTAKVEVQYMLSDASGQVIKSGNERLVESASSMPFTTPSDDDMPILKAAFHLWIRRLAKL